ncbi:MAG: hypothetical protein VX294_13065 [Candidatus Latescibacterota bacterium]|nr:hypothetical protein [Candidatus Latescibacterota bacterium]
MGVGIIIIGESIILRALLGEWHIRIWETLGFISGSKGNHATVDKTTFWWLEQIWFKVGAFLWGGHIPTAVMFSLIPHLYLGGLWKLRKRLKNHYGLLIWGLVWICQHMLISPQEQEPRYMQVAIPFGALVVGLGFRSVWESLSKKYKCTLFGGFICINLACAGIFYATFSPISYAIENYIGQLKMLGENTYVDGPSEYEIRLAHYAGVTTPYTAIGIRPITHWAKLSYGYTKKRDNKTPPPLKMEKIYHKTFESPLKHLFNYFNTSPSVGEKSSITIYSQREK